MGSAETARGGRCQQNMETFFSTPSSVGATGHVWLVQLKNGVFKFISFQLTLILIVPWGLWLPYWTTDSAARVWGQQVRFSRPQVGTGSLPPSKFPGGAEGHALGKMM